VTAPNGDREGGGSKGKANKRQEMCDGLDIDMVLTIVVRGSYLRRCGRE
jgi:hypothetical protein